MSATNGAKNTSSMAEIFSRLWNARGRALTPDVAEYVLRISFPPSDRKRNQQLAAKNQRGRITDSELTELSNYVEVGDMIALMQSKARQALKRTDKSSKPL